MAKAIRGQKPQKPNRIEVMERDAEDELQAMQGTPVSSAFTELDHQTSILEKLLVQLEDRLTPVLHPIVTGSGTDGDSGRPVLSPIVHCINDYSDRISVLVERLENLLPRIEC